MSEWYELRLARPEDGALIELKNGGTCYLADIHPEANSVGLYWRYTGIARAMGYGKPRQTMELWNAYNTSDGFFHLGFIYGQQP